VWRYFCFLWNRTPRISSNAGFLGSTVILEREEQFEKAMLPMDVTLAGMMILARDVHPWKALLSMVMMLSGLVTVVRKGQLANAASLMRSVP